ncbi:MAG: 6-bladed beta-propeller [Bacteroidales bacterium]
MKLFSKIAVSIIIIFLILFSCKESEKSSIPVIDIAGNIDNFKQINLSDLVCNMEYVVLESIPEAMLRGISFLDISEDYILVSDMDKCLLFDRSGNFISRIGSEGRGPGENDAFIQVKIFDDRIFLPDARSSKINIFNTKGEFLKTFKSPGAFAGATYHNWIVLTDTTYLVQIPDDADNGKYRIALINDKGEILNGFTITAYFNDHEASRDMRIIARFYKRNDKVFYKELFNDTIWQVDENSIEPKYVTNLGENEFSFDYKTLSGMSFVEKFIETVRASIIFESNSYITFTINLGRKYNLDIDKAVIGPGGQERMGIHQIIGLYDKQNDEFFLVAPSNVDHQIEPTGIKNDIDGGINFMPRYAVNDTLIVSWFEAYELKMYVASEAFKNSTPKYPEKKEQLEELAASVDENDNPVLMLVKLTK